MEGRDARERCGASVISNRPLNRRQLDAIGKRMRALGDMPIPIAHLTLARLCITAQAPYGFGIRMLEIRPDDVKREVDAAALNALLLIAESKLPKEPRGPVLHTFEPDRRAPWFCRKCGYGPGEVLKHIQGGAA